MMTGCWPTIVNRAHAPCETAAGRRTWAVWKCERPHFALQKAVFQAVKSRLLQPERRPFVTCWLPGSYAGTFSVAAQKPPESGATKSHNGI